MYINYSAELNDTELVSIRRTFDIIKYNNRICSVDKSFLNYFILFIYVFSD